MTNKEVVYRCTGCSCEMREKTRFFPFCSERCKLLDLGAWASEKYRIGGRSLDEEEDRNT